MTAFTDDEFSAASADINDQTIAGFTGRTMRHTQIDQARLFDTGNDLDGVSERFAGAIQKRALAPRLPKGIGAHYPHGFGIHVAQPLTESLQTYQGALSDFA